MPSTTPTTIAVQHSAGLSVSQIVSIVSAIVQIDAPVVIGSLPISATAQTTAMSYIGLGEIGIELVAQIAAAIAAAKAPQAA